MKALWDILLGVLDGEGANRSHRVATFLIILAIPVFVWVYDVNQQSTQTALVKIDDKQEKILAKLEESSLGVALNESKNREQDRRLDVAENRINRLSERN